MDFALDNAAFNKLSRREKDVTSLAIQGLSNKEIGVKLYIAEKTVKFHLTRVFRKLKLKSRARLIVYALTGKVFI